MISLQIVTLLLILYFPYGGLFICDKWFYNESQRTYSVCRQNPCVLEKKYTLIVISNQSNDYTLNMRWYAQACHITAESNSVALCIEFLQLKVNISYYRSPEHNVNEHRNNGVPPKSDIYEVRVPSKPFKTHENIYHSLSLQLQNFTSKDQSVKPPDIYTAEVNLRFESKGRICGIMNWSMVRSVYCESFKVALQNFPKVLVGIDNKYFDYIIFFLRF